MTDDHRHAPATEKERAALSAAAGIGRSCPFCGRREKDIRAWKFVRITESDTTQLECLGCGARGPRCKTGDDKGPDLLRALTKWNERQGEDRLLQERHRKTVQ